ncbi:uncharacterized protein LOC111643677 [Copidosoma floridanum]|uniref:uncharacterized protein LOC111643677 n=1 Tax=Copidosoma floridanum TaxID=29053 RepID=UPI000C6F7DE4|nr:uncharacterized protein LOC111643677 [Copidosoma floridanum]
MAIEYSRFMDEYVALGHMRPLSDALVSAPTRPVYYIPHHGIWQRGDRGSRLRVVFNASHATSSGYSLNDVLHTRPRLQAALPTVLLRWRRHRFAFCTDARMMFRQIQVNPQDVDLQLIVWSPDPSIPPTHYQLLTVTYGVSCSPYLSLRVIQQLCEDEGHRWPGAATAAMRDRYADDILSGADNLDAAHDLPEEERLRSTWQELATDGFVSELGVCWDPASDHFRLTPPRVQAQDTKRTILAALARLFDPCGWLAPTILNAKFLLQDLWRAGLDWDEVVPPSMARQWSAFASELQAIHGFAIPRWIGWSPDLDLQLHAFSDASRRAMAAVTFSQLTDSTGLVHCYILLAKTKLQSEL